MMRGWHDPALAQAAQLFDSYAAGEITRTELLNGLAAVAMPGQHDPTGGDGYIPGTRDVIRAAVGEGLIDEDDWNAIFKYAKTYPDIMRAI